MEGSAGAGEMWGEEERVWVVEVTGGSKDQILCVASKGVSVLVMR